MAGIGMLSTNFQRSLSMRVYLAATYGGMVYPQLISFAAVTEDDRSYYAELSDTWKGETCEDEVVRNILPLLGNPEHRLTLAQTRQDFLQWSSRLPAERYDPVVTNWCVWDCMLGLSGQFNLGRRPAKYWPSKFLPYPTRPHLARSLTKVCAQFGLREHFALDQAFALRTADAMSKQETAIDLPSVMTGTTPDHEGGYGVQGGG
jgi:hypothetical protein